MRVRGGEGVRGEDGAVSLCFGGTVVVEDYICTVVGEIYKIPLN